jgi:hypothetical protein
VAELPKIISVDDHVVEPPLCFPAFPRFCGQAFTGCPDRALGLAYSEGQIGWLPYLLERADTVWHEHRAWIGVSDIVPEPPSSYAIRMLSLDRT